MSATLLVSTAVELVRKNLDELEPNGSVMYADEDNNNSSLDDIIERNLPEAINAVQKVAPVQLLEGEEANIIGYTRILEGHNRPLGIHTSGDTILRVVAFRVKDSEITLTDYTPEASVEGRKQLNEYTRGTYDKPVLVREQANLHDWIYYSLKDTTETVGNPVATFQVIYEKKYADTIPAEGYAISSLLRQNIIDYLTARVMETYSDQRAQAFFTRALQFA